MYNNDLLFLCIFIHNKLFKLIIIMVVQLARWEYLTTSNLGDHECSHVCERVTNPVHPWLYRWPVNCRKHHVLVAVH